MFASRVQADKSKAQTRKKLSLEDLFASVQSGETQELQLIIKADVQGSLEPIILEMEKLGEGEIGVRVLYAETGNIGENDVILASASKASLVGFNVEAASRRPTSGRKRGRFHPAVRYHLSAYRGHRKSSQRHAGARSRGKGHWTRHGAGSLFPPSKLGRVAGCRVTEGELRRNAKVRLFRGADMLFEGEMASLPPREGRCPRDPHRLRVWRGIQELQ